MAGDLQRQMCYKGRRLHDKRVESRDRPVFEHIQEAVAAVWNITHGLGCRYPRVLLLDDTGREFFAFVDYAAATENHVAVKMTIPASGKAIVTAG